MRPTSQYHTDSNGTSIEGEVNLTEATIPGVLEPQLSRL